MNFFQAQHRPSTSKLYDIHWKKWTVWCKANKISDPMRPKATHIANHLAMLADKHGLSAPTLRTRRSAIAAVLATKGDSSTAQDPVISGVIKGVANSRAKAPKFIPKWDLAVVLDFLKGKKYKDNKLLSFDLLTYKTVFLVALASGRRASEITNLSGIEGDFSRAPNGSISLRFLPEFLAKNQRPGDPSPTISIPALSNKVKANCKDLALCPVRALLEYRARSQKVRSPNQRALFISVNVGYSKDITRATLSRWLKSIIKEAYLSLQHKDGDSKVSNTAPTQFRAHEIRAWAATMASKVTPLTQVLRAAYWRSPSVFTKHYLRDVQLRAGDGSLRLPAMVAAQTCIPSQ